MAGDSETSIKIYLPEIRQTPLLTVQEEIELAARIKKGDQKARAWMIKANLRLVVKIAHDYSSAAKPPRGELDPQATWTMITMPPRCSITPLTTIPDPPAVDRSAATYFTSPSAI